MNGTGEFLHERKKVKSSHKGKEKDIKNDLWNMEYKDP